MRLETRCASIDMEILWMFIPMQCAMVATAYSEIVAKGEALIVWWTALCSDLICNLQCLSH